MSARRNSSSEVDAIKETSTPEHANMQIFQEHSDFFPESDDFSISSEQSAHNIKEIYNVHNFGTLPSDIKLDKIFQRLITQLDFLSRTANMMNKRLDSIQEEINELNKQNNID